MTTAKQRRRAEKKRRAGRADLDPALSVVSCDNCGTTQENRAQSAFLGPIEPCGSCGALFGTYTT